MAASEVDAELLAILRCPRCRGRLAPADRDLTCPVCRLAFAVVDGVPNFLLEDARPISGGPGDGAR